jgi:hypothetical protein
MRTSVYILIIIGAALATFALNLRAYGIFSCQGDGYRPDRYLALCDTAEYGDYEHGAVWLDLEPRVNESIKKSDVIFLGDSRVQYAFSTDATADWFADIRYYLLGFTYNENVAFTGPILEKLKPRAKVYVITAEFLVRSETRPAQQVLHDDVYLQYTGKKLWQIFHEPVCGRFGVLCGKLPNIFRSRETGAYHVNLVGPRRPHFSSSPVIYDHQPSDMEETKTLIASGERFLSSLPVDRSCVILTAIPTVQTRSFGFSASVETSIAVARGLGITRIAPMPDGLETFDGSHLAPSSAEKWSKAFFEAAGEQIKGCLHK